MAQPRFQAGLGTKWDRAYKEGTNVSTIVLAQVIKVNYKYNSVDLMLLRHKEVLQNSYMTEGKFSAKLPMEFGGRNIYGKPYGEINPIQVGTVVLIGFIESDKSQPVVLGVYADNDVANKLSRVPFSSADATDKDLQQIMNQKFKIYPSLTYENVDGKGNRTVSFTGKTFLAMSADISGNSDLSDDGHGTAYENLGASYYSDKELIEPVEGRAPEILFKHQSVEDNHVFMLNIQQDGTFRTSQVDKTSDWRTYFEMTKDGEIKLKKQFDSTIIGQSLENSEFGIDKEGIVFLRNGDMDLEVRKDGLYSQGKPLEAGGGISEELRKLLEKLAKMIDELGEGLTLIQTEIKDLDDKVIANTAQIEIQAELISAKVSREEVQKDIDEALINATGGKNLYVIKYQSNAELKDDGTTAPSVRSLSSDYIEITEKVFYTTTAFNNSVPNKLGIAWYNKAKGFISYKEVEGSQKLVVTEEAPEEATFLRVGILEKDGIKMMVERGKTSTEYAISTPDLSASIDEAKDTAESAKEEAELAKDKADEAQKEADKASQWISDTANDNKITAFEKINVLKEWEAILKEQPLLVTQAQNYEVSVTEYVRRYEILRDYITPILADMESTTDITGTEFRDKFNNYYTERTKLLGAISDKTQENLDEAQKDLDDKISKKETSIIKQPTPPLNPTANQLWMNTSSVPNILFRWNSVTSNWEKASATEASEVGAYTDVDGSKLANRVTEAESKITADAITNTVINSTDYTDTIQKLTDIMNNGLADANGRIDEIDLTPYVLNTEFEQTMKDFLFTVSSSGGVNKIQNSLGMANLDFWNLNVEHMVSTTTNISGVDFPSGFQILNNTQIAELTQDIPVSGTSTNTLSFYMRNNRATKAGVSVKVNNVEVAFVGGNTVQSSYAKYEATFSANDTITLTVHADAQSDTIITGMMLNIGSVALTWQNYPSELYSANVLIDLNGLRVYNNRSSNYTVITPDEFSGYALVDGKIERVFTLNEDVTEVKKLSAEKELKLPPFKIVTIENELNNGWAIVKV